MFKLSITGSDNEVNIKDLQSLALEYPQLELAILYLPEKENQARNPGKSWRDEFFSLVPNSQTAIHLCGGSCFNTILNDDFEDSELFIELKKTQRIQMNINARKKIFNNFEIYKIYSKLLKHNFTLILQYHERSQEWIIPYIENVEDKHKQNIHILLDSSLGKGVSPDNFSVPEELKTLNYPIGFAGGLNPENISSYYHSIKNFDLPAYWLDLESGSRTENKFDMLKAKELCKITFE